MSTAETSSLLPQQPEANENNSLHDPEPAPSRNELPDLGHLFRRGIIQRRRRGPLHILILYGLSLVASIGGVAAALWGYTIVLTGPLDDYQRKQHRDSYEAVFVGMQSVVILVCPNEPQSRFGSLLMDKYSLRSTYSGVLATSTSHAKAGMNTHGR